MENLQMRMVAVLLTLHMCGQHVIEVLVRAKMMAAVQPPRHWRSWVLVFPALCRVPATMQAGFALAVRRRR